MLAHEGLRRGVMVADLIAGKVSEVEVDSFRVSAPEIAWVGLTKRKWKDGRG